MGSGSICLLLCICALLLLKHRQRKRNTKLPPGPKGLPLLGVTQALLDTSVKPWTRFTRWSKEHDKDQQGMITVPTLLRTNIVIK